MRDGDHYVINGQKVWTSRALHSDLMLLLARTTPREEVAKKTDGLVGVPRRHARGARQAAWRSARCQAMINHNATEVFFDNLRVPAENLIGEEGKGFRYILDGMNAERILVSHESIGDATLVHPHRGEVRQRAHRVRPPDRPEPGHPVPDRARLRRDCRPPT